MNTIWKGLVFFFLYNKKKETGSGQNCINLGQLIPTIT